MNSQVFDDWVRKPDQKFKKLLLPSATVQRIRLFPN